MTFPTRDKLIEAMQAAYWNMPKDDHLIPDDSQLRVEAALDALLAELPEIPEESQGDDECAHCGYLFYRDVLAMRRHTSPSEEHKI